MKIQQCYQPYEGIIADTPVEIYASLAPWSVTEYRVYDFGNLLEQKIVHKYFRLYIFKLTVEKMAYIKLIYNPGMSLQATLAGNGDTFRIGLPSKGNISIKNLSIEPFETVCEPGTTEWIQIEWNQYEDNSFTEDIITYRRNMFEKAGIPGDSLNSTFQIRLTFIARAIINRIISCAADPGYLALALKISVLNLILGYFNDLEENISISKTVSIPHRETILQISEKIKEDPNIHKSAAFYTKKYHISQTSLRDGFMKVFGATLFEFIEIECMKNGLYLLQNTGMEIEDIAYQFGYATTSNFARAFKRHFDHSPAVYRKK